MGVAPHLHQTAKVLFYQSIRLVAALHREYPDKPVLGVGAVIIREGRILLVRRGSDPGRGVWSVPGGVVELGESLRNAVRREVREECGVEVEVGDLCWVSEVVERDEMGRIRFHYVILDFFADYVSGELRAGSDALEARWVPLRDLRSLQMSKNLVELLKSIGVY